jgi:hypothetical protein
MRYSAKISQMLFVFDREVTKDEADAIIKTEAGVVVTRGLGDVVDSGLTPPTAHIVERRFDRTRRHRAKFTPEQLRRAEDILQSLESDTRRDVEIVGTLSLVCVVE